MPAKKPRQKAQGKIVPSKKPGRKLKPVNVQAPRSLTDLAAASGLNYRRILRLRQDGKLVQREDGTFDVAATLQAAEERAATGPWSDRGPSKLSTLKEQNLEASTRLKQLTVARMAGKLVPMDDVVRIWDERINELRTTLRRLSRDLAPLLEMKPKDQIKLDIDNYLPGLVDILIKGKNDSTSAKS